MRGRTLRHILATGILLWLTALLPSGSWADAGDQAYVEGRKRQAAGDRAGAASFFRETVSQNPDHVEARYHLGLIYMENVTTYGDAEREFLDLPVAAMRAGSALRDDVLFRSGLALAKLYVKSGRSRQAIQLARNVIASAPPNAPVDDAYNTLGTALYYERLYEDAIFELKRAIKLNPANIEARFNLKTIRARLEHFHAGKIYSRMRERAEAIAQFRKAIALDPRFVGARHRLGVELLAAGESEEALKELKRAESVSSGYGKVHEIWHAEGLAFKGLGRTEEAEAMFLKTAADRPGFAAAHNEIGKIHLGRQEYDEAIQRFVRAIGIDPRTEYVRNLQAAFSRKRR